MVSRTAANNSTKLQSGSHFIYKWMHKVSRATVRVGCVRVGL